MPEVKLKAPVRAQYIEDWGENMPPAAYTFYTGAGAQGRWIGLIYACPCGCGAQGSLPFEPPTEGPQAHWEWDGNREAPTLMPSINHVGHWHGYLTKGFFRQPEQTV